MAIRPILLFCLGGLMCLASTGLSDDTLSGTKDSLLLSVDHFDQLQIQRQDVQVAKQLRDDRSWLHLTTGHKADWPGITLRPRGNPWDLSSHRQICLEVCNIGNEPVTVYCRIDSPGGDGQKNSITNSIQLKAGESKELRTSAQARLDTPWADKLFGMRGYPGGYTKEQGLDTSTITQLIIFVSKPQQDHDFLISDIRAEGTAPRANWLDLSADEFFPMIDRFGQFIHSDWPGKVHDSSELREDIQHEDASLTANPTPAGWSQYGGWQAGPQLEATGYFRTAKYQNKWWLVDPEGRLFWSHGVDCVGFSNGTTPITDREFYFADLPSEGSPESAFFGHASWAPHGYYEGKGRYRTFNFTGANLWRKFGDQWQQRAIDLAHRRLRSWGMNSVGNWSDAHVYLAAHAVCRGRELCWS